MQAINGVPKFQKDKLYEDSRSVTDSNPINSALNMDVSKTLSSAHMLNIDNHESLKAPARFLCSDKLKMLEGNNYNVPMAGYLYPDGEGEPQNKLISENKISVLQNRARISGGINTLRELLPHSEEGSKASVLDDTIDYIKYLQLQIKMLSQSRLGGEAAAAPFTHLEGYGHYLFHQEMLNEPLEEMIGKLMELDIATATQLLDSKGLSVIPIALAEGVFQKR
ncbi:transcription factor bHLH7-like isoform X3 [Macadamia integrifolia]|uniref:transcription factor bHLH7-like isoform X3 n=1 Tax=Macadamia integrifolia TaxID=60698 RepID=UPI001C4EAF65|nr:transcription factor bHLH7-like isoform X3 [Macadamia integrifolia]